jgi:predicted membrane protein (TIGR00267 family)
MIVEHLHGLGRHLVQARGIARRYAIVNGFDGALTMLGLLSGFLLSEDVTPQIVIGACVGAAVALGVSGVTSAYLSEAAERRRALAELEAAMVTDLGDSDPGRAARLLPWIVALVNGGSPVLLSCIIISPLWLAEAGIALPFDALSIAISVALACIFSLGLFLGQIAGSSWLLNGVKALLVALLTMLIIHLL